ncbi:protein of unknown function [Pseudorhizobium banfieldiae]|uniref:Uncharacterized protein n=1 Tax=Pseudorhizobium banfieldiae TaxID=1125847 RepID=L0NGC5_9HYPH|nr:protein of unknown function [Pseudorhizobium banfieldiae]
MAATFRFAPEPYRTRLTGQLAPLSLDVVLTRFPGAALLKAFLKFIPKHKFRRFEDGAYEPLEDLFLRIVN